MKKFAILESADMYLMCGAANFNRNKALRRKVLQKESARSIFSYSYCQLRERVVDAKKLLKLMLKVFMLKIMMWVTQDKYEFQKRKYAF